MTEGGAEERLERLVAALVNGMVVPFVGSGASADSVPLSGTLVEMLCKHLENYQIQQRPTASDLPRVVEVLYWNGKKEGDIARLLELDAFANAPPTRAHRYLALLACEGLVQQIITTNFDCGLEKAWRQAKGSDAGLQVISALEDHDCAGDPAGRPRLRIYKINGCAGKFRKAEECGEPGRVELLLSDRQLQRFGKRRWAREMLAHTLRGQQLLLTGFGSDEPQVWHVVASVMEEFEALHCPRCSPRLWVALFDRCLPFHLRQALMRDLEGRNTGGGKLDTLFSSQDADCFGLPKGVNLDAGFFLRKLWLRALQRLLSDVESGAGSGFFDGALNRRYRGDPRDNELSRLWETAVQSAWDVLRQCLVEPRRADGTSRWNKVNGAPPEVECDCAPDLACLSDGFGVDRHRYLSVSDDRKYWARLVLAIGAFEADLRGDRQRVRIRAGLQNGEPAPFLSFENWRWNEIALADPGRHGLVGPTVQRGDKNPPQVKSEADVLLRASFDVLRALGDRIQALSSFDELTTWIRDSIENNAVHHAREAQRDDRDARRKPV